MDGTGREDFAGTERYVVERRLGRGGYGVVFQAFDRQQNARVALKTLHRAGADALYRFKLEFRALADISHINLVTLYDLISDGEQWFFTMELVDGVDFLSYVRRGSPPAKLHTAAVPDQPQALAEDAETLSILRDDDSTPTLTEPRLSTPCDTTGSGASGGQSRRERGDCPADLARLRTAARQLAEGLAELHQAGTLHRDIKPSNVLVNREGRVVVLDFGLIAHMDDERGASRNRPAGTPEYMAPEQSAGLPCTEAADWYAVGVILFKALTGQLPFTGTSSEVIAQKQHLEAPDPSELADGIPEDLKSLCLDLLKRNPESRPAEKEVLLRLGVRHPSVTERRAGAQFVGREEQLEALNEALISVRKGRTMVALAHGPSGIGKTAVVNCFLDNLLDKPDVLILVGRCFERESVPYQAFDSVIDQLVRYLKHLPSTLLEQVLPRDLSSLIRLFPIFREVDFVWRGKAAEIADIKELRRCAFATLRELLTRLAEHKTLVVFIDDLHWGDADSAALLSGILQPPHSPRILLIACYRAEEGIASPLLQALRHSVAEAGSAAGVIELPLVGLSQAESARLAIAYSGAPGNLDSARAAAIARDSAGNPLFISELVRAPEAATPSSSLDQVIQARIARLAEPARRLLEVVAVAGQPMELELAKQAAQHRGADYDVMTALRGGHLVRTWRTAVQQQIEAYHGRIREAAISLLAPQVMRECHARLANAMEASRRPDFELLAVHFHKAGDGRKAANYAAAAADQAADALGFERAARLYQFACGLEEERGVKRRDLRSKLGDALSNAGRGAEAADAYLAATDGAPTVEILEYRRRAAAQLLMSGHLERGIGVLRDVLAASGMRLAPTPWLALLSVLFRRVLINLRGLRFREADPRLIPSQDILRIDTCWSVAQGLGMVDTIRAADFQMRHLLLALRAGDPYRISRALAVEAGYHATAGGRSRHRTAKVLNTNRLLAGSIQDQYPHAIGLATMVEGMAAFLRGNWRDARNLHEQAEAILRNRCCGVAWELATARLMWSVALFFLGELSLLADRLPGLLREAEARGDLYEATDLRIRIAHAVWLAAGQPDLARREIGDAIARWPRNEFYVQHWWSLIANIEISLYSGQGHLAWDLLSKEWPRLKRSLLLRVQYIRIESLYHRGAAALSLAAADITAVQRRALLKVATSDARGIQREHMPWSDPLALLLHAGVAAASGDRQAAGDLLHAAEAGFRAADMHLYAAASQRRRGEIVGGDDGLRLIQIADAWMLRQRIQDPARMTEMVAPGRWTLPG
jgi:eukaryotic-like serine/threonine-protein kinase